MIQRSRQSVTWLRQFPAAVTLTTRAGTSRPCEKKIEIKIFNFHTKKMETKVKQNGAHYDFFYTKTQKLVAARRPSSATSAAEPVRRPKETKTFSFPSADRRKKKKKNKTEPKNEIMTMINIFIDRNSPASLTASLIYF
jgi:hypothetical protein